jgi:predicted metal-binding protein
MRPKVHWFFACNLREWREGAEDRNPVAGFYIEPMTSQSVISARLRRAPPILVCKKCLGRIDDGKQLRKALKSVSKSRSVTQNVKPPRVVMTSCLGICPKRAVVVASAATLQEGRYLLLSDAAASAQAIETLMPDGER